MDIACPAGSQARSVDSRSIPVVDLGPVAAGEIGALEAAAKKWRSYMEADGYLCIVNHGLPVDLTGRMEEQARKFHELGLTEKLQIKVDTNQRGFIPAATGQAVDDGRPKPTASEVLVLATEHRESDPGFITGKQFYARNQWPAGLPEFRPVAEQYMCAMIGIGLRMLPLWALALELEANYFDPYFEENYTYFRMAHYPAQAQADVLGSNPHVDAGFMTIIPRTNVEGLQFQGSDGSWFWPEIPSNALIIHAGAFLEQWSNHRFKAARHRVVSHPEISRYSLPCFINPDFEVIAECLPGYTGVNYTPQSFWEYFSRYMHKTYSHY